MMLRLLTGFAFLGALIPGCVALAQGVSLAVIGDTHLGNVSQKWDPLFSGNATFEANKKLVKALNRFKTDTTLQATAQSFGFDPNLKGIVISGDLTEDGQEGELAQWLSIYAQKDSIYSPGMSQFPVFETAGNHDYPWRQTNAIYTSATQVPALSFINGRLLYRDFDMYHTDTSSNRGSTVASDASGHYAIKWGDVLLINLGVKATDRVNTMIEKDVDADGDSEFRNIHGFGARTFLENTLKSVATTGSSMRVVLNFHYALSRTGVWGQNELNDLYKVLHNASHCYGHKVVAMFGGHYHKTRLTDWCGIPMIESGSPHSMLETELQDNVQLYPPDGKRPAMQTAFALFSIQNSQIKVRSVTVDYNWENGALSSTPVFNFDPTPLACEYGDGDVTDDGCFSYSQPASAINLQWTVANEDGNGPRCPVTISASEIECPPW